MIIVSISDFERVTGVSRQTVYSWIYRNKMPKGLDLAGIGKTKILQISKENEHYNRLLKELINDL